MSTYCPSCGLNVEPRPESAAGRVLWRCANCDLILRADAADAPSAAPPKPADLGLPKPGDQVLGRISLAKVPAAQAQTQPPPAPVERPKPTPARPKPASSHRGKAEAQTGVARIRGAFGPNPAPATSRRSASKDAGAPFADAIEFEPDPSLENVVFEPMGLSDAIDATARAPVPAPTAPPAPVEEPTPEPAMDLATPTNAGAPIFDLVVVAEDVTLLREILRDVLTDQRVSAHVETCADGEKLVESMARLLSSGRRPGLVLLDVEMPVLNGLQAAIALRALERGLGAPPTPVIFLTSRVCDEAIKRVLDSCQPARYLNKGADTTHPTRIAMRLAQVLSSLRQ